MDDRRTRKRPDDRQVLQGLVFVLHTGIAWEHLPQEPGYGSTATRPPSSSPCWRSSHRYAAGAARPVVVLGGGYDHDKYRRFVRAPGVRPQIAPSRGHSPVASLRTRRRTAPWLSRRFVT
ncbi:transposase [Microbispora sp. CA-135349]|uniref:transposase n=1 Tax=Microbispora sp. CA-135349 TaxID=3239953 RepID=UPI003D936249